MKFAAFSKSGDSIAIGRSLLKLQYQEFRQRTDELRHEAPLGRMACSGYLTSLPIENEAALQDLDLPHPHPSSGTCWSVSAPSL